MCPGPIKLVVAVAATIFKVNQVSIYVYPILAKWPVSFCPLGWGFSIYGVKLFSTHKYKIPSGGISQIDGFQAGKITYEYYSLLVVRKWFCLPPSHQFDCFHHRGSCFYGWQKVFASTVVSSTNGWNSLLTMDGKWMDHYEGRRELQIWVSLWTNSF